MFYVAKGSLSSILSSKTSQKLNLIKAISVTDQLNPKNIIPYYRMLLNFSNASLINGMGEYKGTPVRIHVGEVVKPIALPHPASTHQNLISQVRYEFALMCGRLQSHYLRATCNTYN